MDNARIAIFEDIKPLRMGLRQTLESYDHSITAEAGSLSDALGIVKQIKIGRIAIDFLILDNNLTDLNESRKDAKKIYDSLEKERLYPVILGYSNHDLSEEGVLVAAQFKKGGIQSVAQYINTY